MRVEHNPVRCRNLDSGFAGFAPFKEGYCVALIHRDAYLLDGSITNRTILASMRASGASTWELAIGSQDKETMLETCSESSQDYPGLSESELRSLRATLTPFWFFPIEHHLNPHFNNAVMETLSAPVARKTSIHFKLSSSIYQTS